MGCFQAIGGSDAEAAGRPGGEFMGRGAAGEAARVAGGSREDRRAVARREAAGADQGAWAADAPDAELCAADGAQAPLRLGLRDAGAGGVRLAAPAPLLPDPAARGGTGRVD